MASLKLEHVYKMYSDGVKAVNDFTLDVKDGEFIVFVGPSGCGKSTTLRMIAGLESITAGEIAIGDTVVNTVEPKNRDIAMVFQNYALYPQMTVYENLAFGLRIRHVPEAEIQKRILAAAKILGITAYLDKKPKAMSGGQRQRVALGRAILRNPKVMLLDEPLSNLDAKLRTQMRSEIAKLHSKLKTTFLYVTHDQVEAMTLGDRVVVMNQGRIQQVDTPEALYRHPVNLFVAEFIGTPQMNVLEARLIKTDSRVRIQLPKGLSMDAPYSDLWKIPSKYLNGTIPVIIGIRAEDISLSDPNHPNSLPIAVSHIEDLGSSCLVYGQLKESDKGDDLNQKEIVFQVKDKKALGNADLVYVTFDAAKLYAFDKATQASILMAVPPSTVLPLTQEDGHLTLNHQRILLREPKTIDPSAHYSLSLPLNGLTLDPHGSLMGTIVFKETLDDGSYLLGVNTKDGMLPVKADAIPNDPDVRLAISPDKASVLANDTPILGPIEENLVLPVRFLNANNIHGSLPASALKAKAEAVEAIEEAKAIQLRKAKAKADAEIAHNKALASQKDALIHEWKVASQKAHRSSWSNWLASIRLTNAINKERKAEREAALKAIKASFDKLRDQENQSFKETIRQSKDHSFIQERKDEHARLLDSLKEEEAGSLEAKGVEIDLAYEAKRAQAIEANQRHRLTLLNQVKESKAKIHAAEHPDRIPLANYRKAKKAIETDAKTQIDKANKQFFLSIADDGWILCPRKTAGKVLQALQSRAFEKTLTLSIPAESIRLSDGKGNGLEAIVLASAPLGKDGYLVTLSMTTREGKKTYAIVTDKPYANGSKVYLSIDLSASTLYDKATGLRLA